MSGTTVSMSHDKHVNMHGFKVAERVKQGFTLDRAGLCDVDVQNIGRQPFRSELKGGAGARTGLEEKVNNGFASQQGYFFYRLLGDTGKGFRSIKDLCDQLTIQSAYGQEMAQATVFVNLQIMAGHAVF
jgi:hypothetical protein